MRLATCAAAAALAASTFGAVPAHGMTVMIDGDPAAYWTQVLTTGLAGSPTLTSRGFALVSVAIHDAVNATAGNTSRSYLGSIATPGGDTRAAASVAAHDVLVQLNPAKAADFDAALNASLALIPNGQAKTDGIATGAAIAAAALANRSNDGLNAPSTYAPSGLAGRWAPTPLGFAPAALPQWATMDPWLLVSQDQFRPGAPPTLDSAGYAAAFNEVKEIGSATSLTRTADQTASAQFWATASASGTGAWLQAAIDASEGKNLSTIELAQIFALVSTSVADAVIGIWDAKFTYDFWRPVTAIRAADLDDNAATVLDASWTPLIGTPAHPSYISGHSGVAGAATTILAAKFGDATHFCVTSGMAMRCWNSFTEAAQDAANSRLWGGIHWRFDNEQGLALGRSIGTFALRQDAFDAVPEPGVWAAMIAGFGLIGAALRRRARRLALA